VSGPARLLVVRGGEAPGEDLAREEASLEAAARGPAVLSWWSWPGPVVVLGYAQPATDADLGWCRARGIPVLRRVTGGTGIVHRRDLALSLALPVAHPWARSVRGLYDRFLTVLAAALGDVGVPARRPDPVPPRPVAERSPVCFLDRLADTLEVAGRKAVGCAQARRRDAVLVHALVALEPDPRLWAAALRTDAAAVAAGVGGVGAVSPDDLARAVAARLAAELGVCAEPAVLEPPPRALARYGGDPRWSPLPPGR